MADFKRALHTFFVDGYVLCDPDPACVDAAANKTLSQIAVEAVSHPLVLTHSVGVTSRAPSLLQNWPDL